MTNMKKAYMAPKSAVYEICTNGMLALSLIDNGGGNGEDLGSTDFESGGDFEICTNKKDEYWNKEW